MKDWKKPKNEGSCKPVNERTLAVLMFAQSFMVIIGTVGSTIYLVLLRVILVPWCYPLSLAIEQGQAVVIAMQQSLNFLIYIGISRGFRKAVMAVIHHKDLAPEGSPWETRPQGGSTMVKSRRQALDERVIEELPGVVS